MVSFLSIKVSNRQIAAVPGYDGDSRVEWSLKRTDDYPSALERTKLSLETLRQFWAAETFKSVDLSFDSFAQRVCRNIVKMKPAVVAYDSLFDFSEDMPNEQDDQSQDFVEFFSKFLVDHPDVMPTFVTDLRDWDAFRLAMCRHDERLSTTEKEEKIRDLLKEDIEKKEETIQALSAKVAQLEEIIQSERLKFIASLQSSQKQQESLLSLLAREYDMDVNTSPVALPVTPSTRGSPSP